ncbi:MAG: DNA repair protein RecN, partial [Armatimonadota bacterium]
IYILTGADEAAVDKLGRATAAAEKILAIDPGFATIAETLQASLAAAQDFVLAIREYQDHIEINPTRLEQVEDRLEQIRRLKRKYGDTIGEILTYASEIQAKIEELDKTEERLENIQKHIECVQSGLRDKCDRLSAIRKNSAPEFAALVERELADLAMNKARFEVSIAQCEPGPKGADVVEFLISPNPGEPVKPLAKIASGGEISRIMLALKTVVKRSYTPVLVFDEIDAGIGGITAQTLGDKLSSLALSCQVLCVTHLPQVASRADSQFAVEKVATGNRTVVKARKLEGEERVREIARMLGGDARSETAMAHARELLERAGRSRTCA